MKLKDLKDNYEMIDRLKLKVSKWWLFKAWLFGKRTQVTDCTASLCLTAYAIFYKGRVYVYKEKKFEGNIGNGKSSLYPYELPIEDDEIDPKAIEFVKSKLIRRDIENNKLIITTNPELREDHWLKEKFKDDKIDSSRYGFTFDKLYFDEETKKENE